MMPSRTPLSRAAATIAAGCFLGLAVTVLAQVPDPNAKAHAGTGKATPSGAMPGTIPAPPPLPPPTRPPIEFFSELLSASPARRTQLLEGKSPAAREVIERRLAEFEALPPEARADAEWNLRLAQFRFYLSGLLAVPHDQRAARLAQAPAPERALLAERLKAWDALDEPTRRQVLESERQFHHFVQRPTADAGRLAEVLAKAGPRAQADVEAEFARWRALPEEDRRQRSAAFQALFALQPERRLRALQGLGATERKAMERSLERFSNLSPAERDRCIAGLDRLARLAPHERDAFLRHAALWQAMSADERDQWRRLVFNLHPPPLPVPKAPALVSTNR
jgi:hypothetical protein